LAEDLLAYESVLDDDTFKIFGEEDIGPSSQKKMRMLMSDIGLQQFSEFIFILHFYKKSRLRIDVEGVVIFE